MRPLTLAAVTLNQLPLDWAGNLGRVRTALAEARAAGATVVCLPELCLTGYGCEDAFAAPFVHAAARRSLEALLPDTAGLIVAVGLPFAHQHAVFNTVAVIADGDLLGLVAKRHLAGDGVHYEPRWFKPWPAGVVHAVEIGDWEVPLGDLVFEVNGIRFGFEICEDAWVANRPGGRLASLGVDVILNPSASHFSFGKCAVRRRFVLEGARAFCTAYVYANLVGNEAGRVIYDGGALIASGGEMLAEGPRFSFADVQVTTATVDLDLIRTQHSRLGSFQPDLSGDGVTWVRHNFEVTAAPLTLTPALRGHAADLGKEEEFTRAVALGLFDYLRKSRARGFVVSLSGGADSTAVVVLIHYLWQLALEELGETGLRAKLAYLLGDRPLEGALRDLLLCAYQATENSGPTTAEAARAVAEAVGATYHHLDVQAMLDGYQTMVGDALGRPLAWATDDIALQNIQARVRAPGIWMLANLRGALLLSTSNRSEAAVGYATMDGDTCGGLSPIAGIDKAFLRQWLRWVETTGPAPIGPVPVVGCVNRLAPTAELRPAAAAQTDEDDLMPYEVLDAIERAAIRDKRGPAEALALLAAQCPTFSHEQLRIWVRRFFTLWTRNQWKRERYAPSFHLDDENLDPKTWCRFPILSGAFAEELQDLA